MALPAFFDPIVTAPRRQQALFGLMVLVAIIAGAYYAVLSPLQTSVSALEQRRASLERELLQSRLAAADLARTRREMAELERRLGVMKERLPSEKEMPPLFRALTDAAFQSGLAVTLFQPREGRVRDFFVEVPIAVSAQGGYHQLGEFLEQVAALPRVVNLTELKATGLPKPAAHVLQTELTLATYIYRPVGSPPAPKPLQPGAAKK